MKTKAIIIIVLTLLIGFALGMLTSAQLRHVRMKQMRTYINGKEFAGMLIEVIQPDDQQKDEIEAIMKKFEKTTREMQGQFREGFDSLSASYQKELDTLLTKEQRERVRAFDQRNMEMMQKMRRDRRGEEWRHMPPGGGRGHGRQDGPPRD